MTGSSCSRSCRLRVMREAQKWCRPPLPPLPPRWEGGATNLGFSLNPIPGRESLTCHTIAMGSLIALAARSFRPMTPPFAASPMADSRMWPRLSGGKGGPVMAMLVLPEKRESGAALSSPAESSKTHAQAGG